jgi:hypothetical protein
MFQITIKKEWQMLMVAKYVDKTDPWNAATKHTEQ